MKFYRWHWKKAMTEIKKWDFIKSKYIISAVKPEQYPLGDTFEVAFLGRSNVGKSSLINSLCRNNHLAKTSGTPGKTKTINFFEIEAKYTLDEIAREKIFLVDLPGYGYAKASKEDKSKWSEFIGLYIKKAEKLKMLYLLIDLRHDLMKNDKECYEWLKSINIPIKIVFTKADKLSGNEIQKQKSNLVKALEIGHNNVIVYSSVKNTGRQELIEHIMSLR